jgi:hypothetical protein
MQCCAFSPRNGAHLIAAVIVDSFHSSAAERAVVYIANAWVVLSLELPHYPSRTRAASRQRMVVAGLALQQYFGYSSHSVISSITEEEVKRMSKDDLNGADS